MDAAEGMGKRGRRPETQEGRERAGGRCIPPPPPLLIAPPPPLPLCRALYQTSSSGVQTWYKSQTSCDAPELYGWMRDALAQAQTVGWGGWGFL